MHVHFEPIPKASKGWVKLEAFSEVESMARSALTPLTTVMESSRIDDKAFIRSSKGFSVRKEHNVENVENVENDPQRRECRECSECVEKVSLDEKARNTSQPLWLGTHEFNTFAKPPSWKALASTQKWICCFDVSLRCRKHYCISKSTSTSIRPCPDPTPLFKVQNQKNSVENSILCSENFFKERFLHKTLSSLHSLQRITVPNAFATSSRPFRSGARTGNARSGPWHHGGRWEDCTNCTTRAAARGLLET